MALEPERQAIFDIFCHVCEKLITYLDAFDIFNRDDCDCYTVVRECFDPAFEQFGKEPPRTDDRSTLLKDLLIKIEGSFMLRFSSNKEILRVLQDYKHTTLNSHVISPARIDVFCKTGEDLSCRCYSSFCNPVHQDSNKTTELIVKKSNETGISCYPDKYGGTSKIFFQFGTESFDFMWYINLPFYFFHEYLSHIHSARFFNESEPAQKSSFEDGWLMYIQHLMYREYIHSEQKYAEELTHRKHYLEKYIYSVLYSETYSPYTRKGYELAREFTEIVGEKVCLKVSFLLSATNYDFFPEDDSIHTTFILSTNKWVKNYSLMNADDKTEALELLELAIDDEEPLKNLLQILE